MLTPQRPLDPWYPSCGCSVLDQSPYLSQIFPIVVPSNSWWYTASHQTSWAVHQWLPSAVQWLIPCLLMLSCHQYYSIPFTFLIYYSADDSLPYQSILSCSLLIPLTQQLIHAPYAYSFLLIPCLLIAYKALTNHLPILDKFCLFPSLFVL